MSAGATSRSTTRSGDARGPHGSTAALLVAHGGLHMVLFPVPIITIFWKDHIGMSLADIMNLQAIFSLAAVVFEFPSGYVADQLGHRTSLLAAAILWVIGWVVYSIGTTFIGMVVAEVVLGAGVAFASGADAALLFGTLQASGRAAEYARWEGRVRAAAQTGESLSSAVGGYLYTLSPRLPFWLQVPVALGTLGSVVAMQEAPRAAPAPARASHLTEAWSIVRHTLLRHARLRAAVALSVALGLSTFVMVWLIQPYMQSRGIPAAWFGPLWAAANLHVALMSLLSARMVETLGRDVTLLVCCLLIALGYGALASSTAPAAVAFYLCFMSTRGLQTPILISALQRDAPPEARASVLSLNALLFRLGFVLIGPPVGILVDRLGLEASLAVVGVFFSVATLACLAVFRRAHAHAEETELPSTHGR
jgi:predicted MFS family arabinose efflux permease